MKREEARIELVNAPVYSGAGGGARNTTEPANLAGKTRGRLREQAGEGIECIERGGVEPNGRVAVQGHEVGDVQLTEAFRRLPEGTQRLP